MSDPKISNSDRFLFKKCRTAWDFGSRHRMNYTYVSGIEALDFGSAIHKALEIIYDPERFDDPYSSITQVEAIVAFKEYMNEWATRIKKVGNWENQRKAWNDLVDLGVGMIEHYIEWSEQNDKEWIPIHSEVKFQVPIPISKEMLIFLTHEGVINPHPYGLFDLDWPGKRFAALHIDGSEEYYLHIWLDEEDDGSYVPVYYQGIIDLIWQHRPTGKYWIVDHKTTSQFGDNEWLDLDPQASSYYWVCKKMLGIDVDGVLFNFLRKKVPARPNMLKSGKLSKDKRQDTTKQKFIEEIENNGLPMSEYVGFLNDFEGKPFFKREETFRSEDELESIGETILCEAIDMLGEPLIYPNPGIFNCRTCKFKNPCKMKQDGSDWEWFLKESGLYEQR